eukprot:m.90472 g.90472  ORF g.90472 m.90472 type:complete len:588 (+) comp36649_c0_seq1:86-1849(+)
MDVDDVDNIVTLLELAHEKEANPELLDDFLYIANALMELNDTVLQETHKDSKASSRLIVLIEDYIEFTMTTNHKKSFNATYSNLAVKATVINTADTNVTGEGAIALEAGSISDWLQHLRGEVNFDDPGRVTASIFVPVEVLHEATAGVNGQSELVLQFIVYRNSKLFSRVIERSWESVVETSGGYQVNSFVISCRIGSSPVDNLSSPIVMTFTHINPGINPTCSWWDFKKKPFDDWSGVGCVRVQDDEELSNRTTCHCYHSTNFAILMDLSGQIDGTEIPDKHEKALAVITYIGCALSSFGLLLTILTILSFPQLRKSMTNRLLVNLSVALFLLVVIFAGGISRTDYRPACQAVAGLLHFSLLSALMWMGAEAVNLYLTIVRIPSSQSRNFLIGALVTCWGLPVLVVIVCISNWTESYGGINYCWIRGGVFYAGLLAPAIAIMLFNGGIFAMVVYSLKTTQKRKWGAAAVQRLKASLSALVLVGLTWAFGALTIGGARLVFHYLFAIFNSLQGFFIFLFYCAGKPDVRRAWMDRLQPRPRLAIDEATVTEEVAPHQQRDRTRLVGGVQCRTASGRKTWKALRNESAG